MQEMWTEAKMGKRYGKGTHTQMKWSDSKVRDWKDIEDGWMPRAVSCWTLNRTTRWKGGG